MAWVKFKGLRTLFGFGSQRAANTNGQFPLYEYADVFENPEAPGDSGCLGSTALPTASGGSDVTSGITQPKFPRNVRMVASAAASSVVTVNGVDQFGNAISEDVTLNGTTSVAGSKVFAAITSFHLAQRIDGAANLTVGFGSIIGTSRRLLGVINGYVFTTSSGVLASVRETTVPVKSTTSGVHGVSFSTALAATKTFWLKYLSDEVR